MGLSCCHFHRDCKKCNEIVTYCIRRRKTWKEMIHFLTRRRETWKEVFSSFMVEGRNRMKRIKWGKEGM